MEELKLHLGCGGKNISGYVNIDVRELPGVDVVDDIKTLSKYQESSASVIYCSHVLEHIGRREYMAVLKRWYHILKPGGVLRLAVPDMEQVFNHYKRYKDLKALRGFIYGGQTYAENVHYCGWDFTTLKSDLMEIGFKMVNMYDWRMTEHAHIDDFSHSHLPHDEEAIRTGKFTDKHMLMSLNVEAFK